MLYEAFEETRSKSEYGVDTAQAACAETVSLTEGMKDLELTESATRQLTNAKKRFERAREMATTAFSNEALSPNDRILAMQYRVMATVLETIDHPADAVAPCKVCIEELNGLPVVQRSFQEQLRTGIMAVKSLFNKEERRKVISGVCLVNRVAYNVKQTVHVKKPFTNDPFAKELLPPLSMIDTGKEKVDLLRDRRVRKILCKQGMENCSVSWILGHDGKEEHGLNNPSGIATNSSGHCILKDCDLKIKVFDNSGKFVRLFRLPPLIDDSRKELSIDSWPVYLASDMNNNIYVLVKEKSSRERWIFKFNESAEQHHRFRVRTTEFDFKLCKLLVSDSGKVVVLKSDRTKKWSVVDVYETDGHFVCSFGEQILSYSYGITAVSDGRVMVVEKGDPSCAHIFSEQGDHLHSFNLKKALRYLQIAFYKESKQVVIAGVKGMISDILYIEIDTNDGKLMQSISIYLVEFNIAPFGIAVTSEGRVAVSILSDDLKPKVIII